jgi:hypothetical protein
VKKACSCCELCVHSKRATSRRERHSALGSWRWKAPPASAKASAVRAAGSRWGLGRWLFRGSSSFSGTLPYDEGVLEGARVGLCCRRAHADSDDFGRLGRFSWVPDSTQPLMKPGAFRGLGTEESQKWRF